jgi:hypothetical protein
MRRIAPPTAPPATAPVGNGFDAWVVVAGGDGGGVVVTGMGRVAVRDGAV